MSRPPPAEPEPRERTAGPGDSRSAAYARPRGHPVREFGILRPPVRGGSWRRCPSRWTDPALTAAQAATSCESAYRPQRSSSSWGCPFSPAVPAAAGIRPRRHPRQARNPEARNRVGPARSCLFPSTPAKREGSPHRPHTPPVVRHRRRPLASPQRTPARTTDPTTPYSDRSVARLAPGVDRTCLGHAGSDEAGERPTTVASMESAGRPGAPSATCRWVGLPSLVSSRGGHLRRISCGRGDSETWTRHHGIAPVRLPGPGHGDLPGRLSVRICRLSNSASPEDQDVCCATVGIPGRHVHTAARGIDRDTAGNPTRRRAADGVDHLVGAAVDHHDGVVVA